MYDLFLQKSVLYICTYIVLNIVRFPKKFLARSRILTFFKVLSLTLFRIDVEKGSLASKIC